MATRVGLSLLMGRLVVGDPAPVGSALLYPLRDLLGFFYWTTSYLSNTVRWRGRVYRLGKNGVMRIQPNQVDPDREAVLTDLEHALFVLSTSRSAFRRCSGVPLSFRERAIGVESLPGEFLSK